MGLSYGAVRDWRPEELDTAYQQLNRQIETLTYLNDDLTAAAIPQGWTGKAARTADKAHSKLVDRMECIVAEVAAVKRTVGEAAEAVRGIQNSIGLTDHLASSNGYRIGGDGSVVDLGHTPPSPDRDRMKSELKARVKQTLTRAEDVDDQLADIMRKADRDRIGSRGANSLTEAASAGTDQGGVDLLKPPKNGTPAANSGWWMSLSPKEQGTVLANHPEWIGNRDGIPAGVRDQANRARLDKIEADLHERYEKAREDYRNRNPLLRGWLDGVGELDELKGKLDSIKAVRKAIEPGGTQLLLVDPSGEMLKAAVADGDVDNAKHVAVFTGGLNTTVDGELVKYGERMHDLKGEAQQHAGYDVATVTWIGYEAPQLGTGPVSEMAEDLFGGNAVWRTDSAKEGGEALADFVNGIDTSRPEDPHITAMGHSYGSLTTSYAVRHDTGVDDVIFFGSPGLGTMDVHDFKVPDGHAYMVESRCDDVADYGWFKGDPSDIKGLKELEPGAIHGHSEYLTRGSESLRNMGAVVAGAPEAATGARR
jgi:hypothetical protein